MTTISTKSTEGALVITTDDGRLDSASAVLLLRSTKKEYNQPVLRIEQAGESGGSASIRIDDPNPDIEFVETTPPPNPDPNDHGYGKYEIAVRSDRLQINGRKADGSRFETFVAFQRPGVDGDPQRPGAGGNIGFGTRDQFGGGHGVIAIANASVPPPTGPNRKPPVGGGVLYVQDGALWYMGPSGTPTQIAPA